MKKCVNSKLFRMTPTLIGTNCTVDSHSFIRAERLSHFYKSVMVCYGTKIKQRINRKVDTNFEHTLNDIYI